MKPIKIVFSNERLASTSGLAMTGAMLDASGISEAINAATVTDKRCQPYIKNGDVLRTYIGLLSLGQTEYDAVDEFKDDPGFFKSVLRLDKSIPSAETLRQRMDSIGSSQRKTLLDSNVRMFENYDIKPSPTDDGYVTVDMDVTPFDNSKTSKEGVSRTYKGYDGYAPMMAYIGREGYLANAVLREGKQHCQNHTPEFLEETLNICHRLTDKPLLIRLDSGNDAAKNFGILMKDGSWFIVKRNMRSGETHEDWLSLAKEHCRDIETPRDGKTVYIGSTWKDVIYELEDGTKETKCLRAVYEITERTVDRNGQFLMLADIEVNTYWTNTDLTDRRVIELYHKHGECEQYHSEIKTDMDVERLPSGKFDTNELVLELTILAYNILRIIGQTAVKNGKLPRRKRQVGRLRLRTVITKLMYMAGHVTEHSRQKVLAIGKTNAWRHTFLELYQRLSYI